MIPVAVTGWAWSVMTQVSPGLRRSAVQVVEANGQGAGHQAGER